MNLTKLILASNSPRRKQILSEAGYLFEVKVIATDESYPADIEIAQVAEHIARKKNVVNRHKMTSATIITADTTVVFGDQILEKPSGFDTAVQMLTLLANRTHQVITGVCISNESEAISFSSVTDVTFNDLSKSIILHYVEKYRPYDKAGAYGIQEWIGLVGIKRINGSYHNVVGLPVEKVFQVLRDQFLINPDPLQ
jgi:septum formation protein